MYERKLFYYFRTKQQFGRNIFTVPTQQIETIMELLAR